MSGSQSLLLVTCCNNRSSVKDMGICLLYKPRIRKTCLFHRLMLPKVAEAAQCATESDLKVRPLDPVCQ
ncbi:hypothetical protein OUZ56_018828 [Daphnia magna]|uniref:Uncharacterized protein n=1 Tax=Daphnia magna TaxID=35525 RepID=A0ABQ9Z9V3_9CRUS|nr:hypothetical protein OUZ56_018828 [Daphnia magna]